MTKGKTLDTNTWGMTARKRQRIKTACTGSRRQQTKRQLRREDYY